jgi:hypothetical protein
MSSLYEETRQLYETVGSFYNLGKITSWGLNFVTYEWRDPTPLNNHNVVIPYIIVEKLHQKMIEMNESS